MLLFDLLLGWLTLVVFLVMVAVWGAICWLRRLGCYLVLWWVLVLGLCCLWCVVVAVYCDFAGLLLLLWYCDS